MDTVFVPPIKCQGIKTKLVPFIRQNLAWNGEGIWVEPFIGSGVVGFNIRPNQALFADSNPHIINFYQAINENIITSSSVRKYLEHEDQYLRKQGTDYYYQVRERFNAKQDPLDFLFLNRAGFNGMIRFNQKGKFNVPFNHKPNRFAKAYISKIVNQVQYVHDLCQLHNYTFICQDFRQTLHQVDANDFVYCDPPYAGRHVDYYNGWSEEDERDLLALLAQCNGRFILSTWHSNEYRSNPTIPQFQKQYHIVTREHYYYVGAKESNRNPVLEALIMNYQPTQNERPKERAYQQAVLLESGSPYPENRGSTF